jgi:hypothetical protein
VVTPNRWKGAIMPIAVSIPQSGFLVVTLIVIDSCGVGRFSFNPSVGILGGHTKGQKWIGETSRRFNPSVGILGGHTCPESQARPPMPCFNPSVGILGGHTSHGHFHLS